MNNFEQQYYEDEAFWANGMVEDPFNAKRLQRTISILPKGIGSLIDVGCGNGVFVNALQIAFPNLSIVGVDRSRSALKFVQTKKIEAEINKLPINDREFDCVSCLEVLEHLPVSVYEESLKELARVSKKYILISVPYNEKLEEAYTKCPQCKSQFNHDLHLRSFNESTMKGLFSMHNFECIEMVKEGYTSKFIGHDLYRKIFYRKQFEKFNSPICPICGFSSIEKEDKKKGIIVSKKANNSSPFSLIKKIPKIFWPKQSKPYWIIALYERNK